MGVASAGKHAALIVICLVCRGCFRTWPRVSGSATAWHWRVHALSAESSCCTLHWQLSVRQPRSREHGQGPSSACYAFGQVAGGLALVLRVWREGCVCAECGEALVGLTSKGQLACGSSCKCIRWHHAGWQRRCALLQACCMAAWRRGGERPKPSAGNLLWVCWASAVISGAMTTMCMAC